MGEEISDYTKNFVDLRRHMWMEGVEVELRRLIWQIAVVGKYISAKFMSPTENWPDLKTSMVMNSWRWIVFPMKY